MYIILINPDNNPVKHDNRTSVLIIITDQVSEFDVREKFTATQPLHVFSHSAKAEISPVWGWLRM